MKVLLLSGGKSKERDISLLSGRSVYDSLQNLGYQVEVFDPIKPIKLLLKKAKQSDIVLPILHGEGGEDGFVQKIFEDEGIKFLGSGSKSCRMCFDKAVFYKKCLDFGIVVPKTQEVNWAEFVESSLTKSPFVLKPIRGGSSIDTLIVRSLPFDQTKVKRLFKLYPKLLLQEFISGQEISIGILKNVPLPIVEIIPPEGEIFDFQNKYNGLTKDICPPKSLNESQISRINELAVKLFGLFECRHLARIDMIIAHNSLYVLEINTMPGFTSQSLYPKEIVAAGFTFDNALKQLLAASLSD